MRKIVIYPSEILRKRAEEVVVVDKKLLKETADMKDILKNGENAAGLAANQIGILKRFFGLKDNTSKLVSIFINPKIEKTYGEKVNPLIVKDSKEEETEDFLEGCLSFPGLYGTVKRYLKIDVSWQEIKDNKLVDQEKTMIGFEAIVFQHELDHLDGILFVDRIKEEKGKFYKTVKNEMVKCKVEEAI